LKQTLQEKPEKVFWKIRGS